MDSFNKLKIDAFDTIKALREVHTGDMYGAHVRTVLNKYHEELMALTVAVQEATAAFDAAWAVRPMGQNVGVGDVLFYLGLPRDAKLLRGDDYDEMVDRFRRAYLVHNVRGYQP